MKLNIKTNRDNRVIHVSNYTVEVTYGKCMPEKILGAMCMEHNFISCTESHFEAGMRPSFTIGFFCHDNCYISNKQFPTYSVTCLYKSILEVFIRGSISRHRFR